MVVVVVIIILERKLWHWMTVQQTNVLQVRFIKLSQLSIFEAIVARAKFHCEIVIFLIIWSLLLLGGLGLLADVAMVLWARWWREHSVLPCLGIFRLLEVVGIYFLLVHYGLSRIIAKARAWWSLRVCDYVPIRYPWGALTAASTGLIKRQSLRLHWRYRLWRLAASRRIRYKTHFHGLDLWVTADF